MGQKLKQFKIAAQTLFFQRKGFLGWINNEILQYWISILYCFQNCKGYLQMRVPLLMAKFGPLLMKICFLKEAELIEIQTWASWASLIWVGWHLRYTPTVSDLFLQVGSLHAMYETCLDSTSQSAILTKKIGAQMFVLNLSDDVIIRPAHLTVKNIISVSTWASISNKIWCKQATCCVIIVIIAISLKSMNKPEVNLSKT